MLFILTGVLSAALSLFIGLYFEKGSLIQYLSYPNLLLPFVVFVASLVVLHRKEWSLVQLFPKGKINWLCVLVTFALFLTYEPFAFKIVYDEPIQAVTAQVIHFTRTVILPNEANDYSGSYDYYTAILDKRPFFFPFLISIIHDITGYRYVNGFILNGILSGILLILINYLGTVFGSRKGGILAVLLAGTIPLFANMATSAGQEILNLVMLCLALVLGYLYLCRPNANRLVPLVFCLILFFQVRYENAIYLLPFGLLILMGWQKAKKPILPLPVMLSPLTLILPTVHYLILSNNTERYFQAGPEDRESTFSLTYFSENVAAAGDYLFSIGYEHSNSILVTIFGIAGCLLFIYYYLLLGRRKRQATSKTLALLIFLLSVLLHLCLILVFNFGLFNIAVTARLSMPLLLLFILICPFVISRFRKTALISILTFSAISLYFVFLNMSGDIIQVIGLQFAIAVFSFWGIGAWIIFRGSNAMFGAIAVTLIYTVVIALPLQHSHVYSQVYVSNDSVNFEMEFAKSVKPQQALWISSAPFAPLLRQINTMPIIYLRRSPARVKEIITGKEYEKVYVIRRYEKDREGNLNLSNNIDDIDPTIYKLNRLETKKFGRKLELHIDELVNIEFPEAEETHPDTEAPSPKEKE